MARIVQPKMTDEELIAEALRSYGAQCDQAAPRHRHTAEGRELRRRAARARTLAFAYTESLRGLDVAAARAFRARTGPH